MSDRHVNLPGTLGGDDGAGFDAVDAYIAALEDASGMPEAIVEWTTRRTHKPSRSEADRGRS